MPSSTRTIVIVGAGGFGLSAAIELRRRGFEVDVVDPGPIPHPDASSTDISKAVRMDYGADELYAEMAEQSIHVWRQWNDAGPQPAYHEVGFLLMTRRPLSDGDYESDGLKALRRRGHEPRRMNARELRRICPAWSGEGWVDGYFNPVGGFVESGRVVSWIARTARELGVRLHEGFAFARFDERGSRIRGVVGSAGERLRADLVLVAAGAWTPALLPHLGRVMRAVGQPVLHFRPADPEPYRGSHFPVWGADISRTGWYGFPVSRDGLVKVANHGPGRPIHPDEPRRVEPEWEERCREFLGATFPGLVDAPLVATRLCLYCDTRDTDFWIDHDPEREGLVVAAGGSGHGFKFVPLLGRVIADVVEHVPNRFAARFAWREPTDGSAEQARRRE